MVLSEEITPILEELEAAIWEYEFNNLPPLKWDNLALRASVKIFSHIMMNKMWELQEVEGMDIETRCAMAEKCGTEIRQLIKTYTNIDMHEEYKNINK